MKQYIIFICFLGFINYAFASNTKNQSAIDCKILIMEQKLENLQNSITEQETILQNGINKQNVFLENNIDRLDKNIDRWISILSVFLGMLSVYLVWKTEHSVSKLEKEVDRCKRIKEEIESYRSEAQAKLNKIRDIDQKAQVFFNKIKTDKLFFSFAPSSMKRNQSASGDKEISLLVNEIDSIKTESQYTSNDWLLKGINAQLNCNMRMHVSTTKKHQKLTPIMILEYI